MLAAVLLGVVLRTETLVLASPAEVIAQITAACAGCSWATPGREAAALRLEVDGRYSQHLLLTRGDRRAEYRVALGRLEAGSHRLEVHLDASQSASHSRAASVEGVAWEALPGDPLARRAVAHAPVLHPRPGARFSDVPLLMWYETEATPRGQRIRYSVVFSNEDGGTPPGRLLATWGRLTDIEYVYGVELDAEGRVLWSEFQGRDHQALPFRGQRLGDHPLLFVVTENNMLSDHGSSRIRFAPAPFAFDLAGVSREAVMDAHPWTYRVSAQEVRREGRVAPDAQPGWEKIADPRRYATVEACAPAEDATLAFALGVAGADGRTRWLDSDAAGPQFRIARSSLNFPNGCFRGAVALPAGAGPADLVSLRVRAYTRLPRPGEPALPKGAGRARLTRVNGLFLMDADDLPGPLLFRWQGDQPLVPEGEPFVLPLSPAAAAQGGMPKPRDDAGATVYDGRLSWVPFSVPD